MKTKKKTQPRPKAGLRRLSVILIEYCGAITSGKFNFLTVTETSSSWRNLTIFYHSEETVVELGQSVERLIAEREVARSIPGTEKTLRVL